MKKWLLYIMLMGVLGMLAASCSQEADDPTQTADSRKAQVVFTIALDSPSAGSRGLWGDNYDTNDNNDYESAIGTDFDNRINPSQFFVKLTLGSETYDVQNIAYWQTSQQNVYEFVGDVNVLIGGTTTYEDAKIQVYANMNPEDGIFSTNYETNPGTGVSYIPMWGVQTVDLSLTPGTRTELSEPIYLLRAMAKVEVALSASDYTLTNVSLNKYNTTGNSLPIDAATTANTKALYYDDNENGYCFNPNTNGAATNLAFNVTDDHLVFYLPEVENNATDELKMTVTLKKGTETVQLNAPYLYFRNYNAEGSAEGATPFDIVRNHWYQYTITAVKEDAPLELTLTVNPWNLKTHDLHYEILATAQTPITWGEGEQPNKDNEVVLTANESTATFSFKLSTPTGATWYATLVPMGGDENAFSFEEGEVVTTISGQVGQSSGTISIHAMNTTGVVEDNNVARLEIIVVTNDGRTINAKNMLGDYTIMQANTKG